VKWNLTTSIQNIAQMSNLLCVWLFRSQFLSILVIEREQGIFNALIEHCIKSLNEELLEELLAVKNKTGFVVHENNAKPAQEFITFMDLIEGHLLDLAHTL